MLQSTLSGAIFHYENQVLDFSGAFSAPKDGEPTQSIEWPIDWLLRALADVVANKASPATVTLYARWWDTYVNFAVAWDLDPRCDETGEILAAFMMKLALLGYAAQTIGIAKAAVGYAYRHATAVVYNPAETEIVRQGFAGLERHFTKPACGSWPSLEHIRKIARRKQGADAQTA